MPDLKLTNEMLESMVDTNDEWIVKRTGIRERRIAQNTATWELALEAGRRALEDAALDASELDLIIVGTATPDFFTPSVSCMVQGKLGASKAMAFDLSAACSGFVYSVDVADSFIRAGKAKNVLVICAETLSRIIDYTDRSTCVIFGDGAAAAVFQASEQEGVLTTYMRANGTLGECLKAQCLPVEDPLAQGPRAVCDHRFLKMAGSDVFRFTASAVPEAIDAVLHQANMTADQIDWFVLHQANVRILQMVTTRYGLDPKKVYVNIDRYGNTSGVSVALCLDEMRKNGQLKAGQHIVISGFGGGLTYGAALIRI
ncbi:3-oxoacyl-ACP synthase [Butyricicoccus pullicaecorum]|uniref:Beta-ketoacyl-[acyl-carrier-protein] synthase III n=2 Tax=Butyricicoccus pullicaecorum TaxID=501571 RepID=A0A1Y4LAX4_9FIRM|nr:3-oxoacyl-ACP synthase [Butyricicoccus pullicaecorum]OUP60888.1 3-oxoacyl-ACP synthase [Butyricicoccus pullicaecorum]